MGEPILVSLSSKTSCTKAEEKLNFYNTLHAAVTLGSTFRRSKCAKATVL